MLDLKESPADQEDTRQALSPPTELNVSGQSNADILKHVSYVKTHTVLLTENCVIVGKICLARMAVQRAFSDKDL